MEHMNTHDKCPNCGETGAPAWNTHDSRFYVCVYCGTRWKTYGKLEVSQIMTNGHKAGWSRLQRISCYHATKLFTESRGFNRLTQRLKPIPVPEVIRENVEILGKGTEEDVKARIHWYITYYPDVFSESRGVPHA